MEKKLTQFEDKKFLLAVSGGVDSMVMLDTLIKAMPLDKFAVVSINHNLRPEGAFDVNFVKEYCKERDVRFFEHSINVMQFAMDAKVSIETAARQLRYKVIEEVADLYGYDYICLAHHAEDNAETVIMHLLRGGGLRGVSGIRRIQGRFFRPILKLTKADILKYAEENQIPYVVDKTNQDTAYKRNYVRHEILPRLKELNPNAVQSLNNFAKLAQEEDEFLDSLVDLNCVKFDQQQKSATFDLNDFNQLHKVLKARFLRKVMRMLGYFKDIEQKHILNIFKLCNSTQGESQIDLPFNLIARRSYDTLCICPNTLNHTKEILQLPFSQGVFDFGGLKLGVFTTPPQDLFYLSVDKDKIPMGAVIRTRKTGDLFKKFGSGEKKLKDYFIDVKIPQHLRDYVPIVAYDNTVYAVFGCEISDKAKITHDTKNQLFLAIL